MCWISVDKDVHNEFHWLFEFQSRSIHMCRNDEFESLSEGKQIEEKVGNKMVDTLIMP